MEIRSGTDTDVCCVSPWSLLFISIFPYNSSVCLGSSDQLHLAGPTLINQLQYSSSNPPLLVLGLPPASLLLPVQSEYNWISCFVTAPFFPQDKTQSYRGQSSKISNILLLFSEVFLCCEETSGFSCPCRSRWSGEETGLYKTWYTGCTTEGLYASSHRTDLT